MPGVIMDNANVEGTPRRPGLNEATNGVLGSMGSNEKFGQRPALVNGPVHVNGAGREADNSNQLSKTMQRVENLAPIPFEIPHITQGFFPFGTLVNRAVQNCWNELSELISELATIQVPADHSTAPGAIGKSPGNQSAQNMHKKLKILEWGQAKKAEFIKLLVLSDWSRQAAEVSRLIDVQGFIRTRHQAYTNAMNFVGVMKQDLVRAQVANPDLKTALEVLAKGRVTSLPDVSFEFNDRFCFQTELRHANYSVTVWLQAPKTALCTRNSQKIAQDQPDHQCEANIARPSTTCLTTVSRPRWPSDLHSSWRI